MSQTFRQVDKPGRQMLFFGVCLPVRALLYASAYYLGLGTHLALILAVLFGLRASLANNQVWWSRWAHAVIFGLTALVGLTMPESSLVAVGFLLDLLFGVISGLVWMH
jgi:hypothetical protein